MEGSDGGSAQRVLYAMPPIGPDTDGVKLTVLYTIASEITRERMATTELYNHAQGAAILSKYIQDT